jgi:NADPH:quinone reductase-like Zn-dependent oxidoreductase
VKAIVQDVYGSADVLKLRDIDKPVIGDRDVLVRVRAAGVDPSVWHIMSGQPYLVRAMGIGLRRPRQQVRGWDLAGTVEAVGGQVTRVKPGDEVFGTSGGSFAEYARAAEDKVVVKPATVSFEQAAAVPTSATTAVQALRDSGRLAAGQRVLVIGAAGGVGHFAVQIARAMGAKVTGVCSTAKLDLVRSIGADDVVDYTRDDVTDGTRRFDLILDNAGNRPLAALRRALTPAGALVIIGGEGGGPWIGGLQRNLGAGLLTLFVKQRLVTCFARAKGSDLEYLRGLMEAGKMTPVIDRTFPLAEAPEAVRYLQHGKTRGGKVVLTVESA